MPIQVPHIPHPSICAVLAQATQQLHSGDTARLDAEVLLALVLNQSRAYLHTWPERELADTHLIEFLELIERRRAGEPLAYITGWREFWSLELRVTNATLIPRPETEQLVQLALQRIPEDAAWKIADLGTGSGAIAIALAHERPRCTLVATDISPAALEVASVNAQRLRIPNIEFCLGATTGDWQEPLRGERFDLIVSNPPYVSCLHPHLEKDILRFEPRLALEAGADGLRDLRAIATQVRRHLVEEGWLLLEHGFDQGAAMLRLIKGLGYQDVEDHHDIAAQPRVITARYVRGNDING